MGYTSEAALILTREAAQALDEFATKNEEAARILRFCRQREKDESSGDELLLWRYLRWDPECPEFYPEIRFLRGFLLTLKEEDYRFARLGEYATDVERSGDKSEGPFSATIRTRLCVKKCNRIVYECERGR